jgi:hypothetical protein
MLFVKFSIKHPATNIPSALLTVFWWDPFLEIKLTYLTMGLRKNNLYSKKYNTFPLKAFFNVKSIQECRRLNKFLPILWVNIVKGCRLF